VINNGLIIRVNHFAWKQNKFLLNFKELMKRSSWLDNDYGNLLIEQSSEYPRVM